ncbi:hypothetical protein [Psychroserpens luteus]|uniref:Zinc ribbon domain-containing protein n=1 Tax=Psychroserpens luteus TaxID=1434066 RepID=A0ABW5ZTP6_9FLAO|nr:hypothetical protein [Psychroserpens luteus]
MQDSNCPNCKELISKIEFDCSNCGFPTSGTEKEKSIFIGKQIANKSKIGNAKESQNKVRLILYIIGGFQIFNGFLAIYRDFEMADYMFYIILGLLFVVFGFLSPRKPLVFISLALILLLAYYTFLYTIDPQLLFQGIIWKFVAIAFLGYGLVNSFEEHKLKKGNKFLNTK